MGLPIAIALTGGEVADFKGYLPVMNADVDAPVTKQAIGTPARC